MSNEHDLHRLATADLELGTTDVLQRHMTRHVIERRPVSARRLAFESKRPRWLREFLAEATGVFIYVYPGLAATAAFTFGEGDAGMGSVFTIGWSYAIGIAFAIITCASTSGGHFSPAITIALAVWQGFPIKKVPYFILAQILGAMMASFVIYGQYYESFHAMETKMEGAGLSLIGVKTPSSIFSTFPQPSQTNNGWLFFIEFFVDTFLGFAIWSCLDPGNPFISPAGAPFIIGLAYGVMIWGFAEHTISTNMARDLGCRIATAILYGSEAFSYHSYWWISIFVSIPATLFASAFYELVMRDSLDRIGSGRTSHEHGEEGLRRHLTNIGVIDGRMAMPRGPGKGGKSGSEEWEMTDR
ncbi:putative glycerol uptake facilitator [Aulographum hederae CBS 113979]|uniref:Putative glycerol uptake facilitator n=1 Tax=Aulographum hederae CBS 113979 TaxID=1176131 RepID=A0A6G1GRS5_9PEZI|nr:putative glycerol uptake facilitator [Aulographum hederae CBS 113979]